MCVPTNISTFNNNKPWLTINLKLLYQAKEETYRSGDTLTEEIRVAKSGYTEKLKNMFSANDPASAWGGLDKITS